MRRQDKRAASVPTCGGFSSGAVVVLVAVTALACGGEEAESGAITDTFAFVYPDNGTPDPQFVEDTNGAIFFDNGAPAEDTAVTEPDPGPPPEDTNPVAEDTNPGPPDTGPAPDLGCIPHCEEKQCGSDGCDGVCGSPCPEKEVCTNFKCVPDPTLGCEGLDLAEDWKGEFDGDVVFSALSFIPIEASTSGEMAFQIKCFNSKLIVSGTMAGEASDNKFSLEMSGTFSPATGTITAKLLKGDVTVFFAIQYLFEGDITGKLDANGKFQGTWSMASTDVKLLGNPSPGTLPLTGTGTWEAEPGP